MTKKSSKILATVIAIVVFLLLFVPIVGFASDAGRGPGFLGLVVTAALIGAISRIWKKDKTGEV